ncbi:hypothetical protein CI105_03760 [Candidatus Izimaplasma bacterium ZiA1]|uniref:hypothetical protein n=1 Tax=Candidatus Izimoplasma sp. ZiA1 TaxID=2024899 RepID=UPI000BAA3964|nr:hypothetical protein CI105_03760 [Candidatus Izimaplasma bacterium ZiA1]
MAEKKERVLIELEKKYLKLTKEDIKTVDFIDKLDKDYSTKILKAQKDLEALKAEKQKNDKNIESKKNKLIKDLMAKFTLDMKKQNEIIKTSKENLSAAELKSRQKLEKSQDKINLDKEKLSNTFDKNKEKLENDSASYFAKSEKAILGFEKTSKEKHDELVLKQEEFTNKHNLKLEKINNKRDTDVEKIEKQLEKSIKTLTKEVADLRKQAKIEIDNLGPVLDEKSAKLLEEISEIETNHNEKVGSIKAETKSKLDRHQEFLDRAIKENDVKSQKLHKKEMSQLSKSTDLTVSTMTKAYEDSRVSLDAKIRDLKTKAINDEKQINKELETQVLLKDEKISSIKAESAFEIEKTKIEAEKQLKNEEDKLNLYNSDKFKLDFKIEEEKDIFIANELANQESNKIELEKTLLVLKAELNKNILKKSNEIDQNVLTSEKEIILAKKDCDDIIAKSESNIEFLTHKIEVDKELAFLNAEQEFYENDYLKQEDISKDFREHQSNNLNITVEREEAYQAYLKTEIDNRLLLNVAQLEKQIGHKESDFLDLTSKIESQFEEEKALFDKEIMLVAQDLLLEKNELDKELQSYISNIDNQISELDKKKDKKKIKLLNKDLEVKKLSLNQKISEIEYKLSLKTAVYDKGIADALTRKEIALKEAETVKVVSIDNLKKCIEYTKELANNELDMHDNRVKLNKELKESFNNQAQVRMNTQKSENKEYLSLRVKGESVKIIALNQSFANFKFSISEKIDAELKKIQLKLDFDLNANSNKSLEVNKEFEMKIISEDNLIRKIQSDANKKFSDSALIKSNKLKDINLSLIENNSSVDKKRASYVNSYKEYIKNLEIKKFEANKVYNAELVKYQKEKDLKTKQKLAEIEQLTKEKITKI